MIEANSLPELVRSTRLEASISGLTTTHTRQTGDQGPPLREEWHQLRELGYGGSGVVRLERRTESWGASHLRAVKCMRLRGELNTVNPESRRYVRELKALAIFSQPVFRDLFVEFYGWYRDQNWLYISMEHCEHLDLSTYLKEHDRLLEEHIRIIARQVFTALSCMHECGFAHRDLKPANILIKSKPPEDWHVKLCDLGLSRRSVDASGMTTVHGTSHFMAPELRGRLVDENPSEAADFSADIWSAGETLSRMMTGEETFTIGTLDYFQRGLRDFPHQRFINMGFSNAAIDFVCSLMKASPNKRPTARQALEHPWLSLCLQKDVHAARSGDSVVHQINEQPTLLSRRLQEESTQHNTMVRHLVSDRLAYTSDSAEISPKRLLLDQRDTSEAIQTTGPRTHEIRHLSFPSVWTVLRVFHAIYVSIHEGLLGLYKNSWGRRFMLADCMAYFCVAIGVFTSEIVQSETRGPESFIAILCLSVSVFVVMITGEGILKAEKKFAV